MSRSATRAQQDTSPRSHASARLGLTLRSVLLSPREGFAGALKAAERRARAGSRPAEGIAPFLFAAMGGASLAALWLKVGSLVGLREMCADRRVAGFIAVALVGGALLAVIAQSVWGLVGTRALAGMQVATTRRDLRLVWGASAFPQVFALVILVPLDLLIVGTSTFTTATLGDPLSTVWAAFSIALGISVAVWSVFLFVRGLEVAGAMSVKRALLGTLVAAACLAICLAAAVGLLQLAASFTSGGSACPTQLG